MFLQPGSPPAADGYVTFESSVGPPRLSARRLTTRQLEVALCASIGDSNAQIADFLKISKSAVKHHLSHIFATFGLSSRRELQGLMTDGLHPA